MNSTWDSLRKVGVPEHLITRIFLLTSARPLTREAIEAKTKAPGGAC